MDHKLVDYFEEELTHVRRMAEEFKTTHPKVAARLQLGQDPPDPYVQQLLDGFAFMAARVQLKLDAEFPRFIESLLQTVYPHYLAPTPSMAIVAFQPQFDKKDLADGPVVRRGARLTAKWQPGASQDLVKCTYVTGHDLQILPISLAEARYYGRDLSEINNGWVARTGAKAAVCLLLKAEGGLNFNQIAADQLAIYLPPREDLTAILYEQLLAHTSAIVVQSPRPLKTFSIQQPPPVRAMGFEDTEALLPLGPRGFSGYRVLQEYFAFPSRFFFIEVSKLRQAFAQCAGKEIQLIFCLNEEHERLEARLQTDCFALHHVPAVNLFPMDNIIVNLEDKREEYALVPDRTKRLEYEVHSVKRVLGRPKGANKPDVKFEFHPFYFSSIAAASPAGFFTARREQRKLTDREIREGSAPEYLGSEVYLSLTGEDVQASLEQLQFLHVEALCGNRHLPMIHKDFLFDPAVGAPVSSIRTVAKTAPQPPHLGGQLAWRVISHLALNYRPLLAPGDESGAAAVQELLRLYVPEDHPAGLAQIRALKKAVAKPVFRRIESQGPIAYARGLAIALEVDERPFKDTGVFLLGSVLDRFFSRYVSLNSFTQTEMSTTENRKVFQWPISKGMRQIL